MALGTETHRPPQVAAGHGQVSEEEPTADDDDRPVVMKPVEMADTEAIVYEDDRLMPETEAVIYEDGLMAETMSTETLDKDRLVAEMASTKATEMRPQGAVHLDEMRPFDRLCGHPVIGPGRQRQAKPAQQQSSRYDRSKVSAPHVYPSSQPEIVTEKVSQSLFN
jgi:hypothetical protein